MCERNFLRMNRSADFTLLNNRSLRQTHKILFSTLEIKLTYVRYFVMMTPLSGDVIDPCLVTRGTSLLLPRGFGYQWRVLIFYSQSQLFLSIPLWSTRMQDGCLRTKEWRYFLEEVQKVNRSGNQIVNQELTVPLSGSVRPQCCNHLVNQKSLNLKLSEDFEIAIRECFINLEPNPKRVLI